MKAWQQNLICEPTRLARSCNVRNFTAILKLFDKVLLSNSKFSSLAPSALAIYALLCWSSAAKASVHERARLAHSDYLDSKNIITRVLSAIFLDHAYSRIETFFRSHLQSCVIAAPTKGKGVCNGVFWVVFVFRDLFRCT